MYLKSDAKFINDEIVKRPSQKFQGLSHYMWHFIAHNNEMLIILGEKLEKLEKEIITSRQYSATQEGKDWLEKTFSSHIDLLKQKLKFTRAFHARFKARESNRPSVSQLKADIYYMELNPEKREMIGLKMDFPISQLPDQLSQAKLELAREQARLDRDLKGNDENAQSLIKLIQKDIDTFESLKAQHCPKTQSNAVSAAAKTMKGRSKS